MPVIAVRFRAKSGQEAALRTALLELAAHSRGEDGCLAYLPAVSPEDPATFFLYEHWRDAHALQAHRETDVFERLAVGKLRSALESSDPLTLEPLEP